MKPVPYGFAAFRTALIRLCHPGPVARNFSSTSASSRIVVETFGSDSGGRPRRTGAASNRARHSGVDMSGMSSSNSSGVDGLLSSICFPQADNPARVPARRPGDENDPTVQSTHGHVPSLRIVPSIVLDRNRLTLEDRVRLRHVQITLLKRSLALEGVEVDTHGLLLLQKSSTHNIRGRAA
jgi:hypothetical protein